MTAEAAGALVLAFTVLLRPIGTAIIGTAAKAVQRLSGARKGPDHV